MHMYLMIYSLLLHLFQTGSGTHSGSSPVGTVDKEAGA
jgi:hypothetical protein